MPAAMGDGADSEAASLAGPVADPESLMWRRVTLARGGVSWDAIEDEDDRNPHRLAGVWAQMVAEDYSHDMPERASLGWCVDYLDRNLTRIAHDPRQDFPLLGRELRKCIQHLEAVIHNDMKPERGATCPECSAVRQREYEAAVSEDRDIEKLPPPPRLRREYAHWCDDPECERQLHFADDSADVWRCPKDTDHWWTQQGYAELLVERRKARIG